MLRPNLWCGLFAVIFSGLFGGAPAARTVAPVKPTDIKEAQAKNSPADPVSRAKLLRNQLAQTAEVTFDPGTKLVDALDLLSDRYNLKILIDTESFKAQDQDMAVDQLEVSAHKLAGIPLRKVLQIVLSQVGGDFLQQDGLVVVVARNWVVTGQVLQQPVHDAFKDRPLNEALQELSALTGVSIILDRRATEKADVRVTAVLNGLPLEGAVIMLADIADLEPVSVDNAFYVTTKKNAKALQAVQEKRKLRVQKENPIPASVPGM